MAVERVHKNATLRTMNPDREFIMNFQRINPGINAASVTNIDAAMQLIRGAAPIHKTMTVRSILREAE